MPQPGLRTPPAPAPPLPLSACSNASPSITFHTLSGEMTVSRTTPQPSTPAPTPPATPPPASASAAVGPSTAAPAAPLLLSLTLPAYPPDDPVPAAAADPTGPLAAACCGGLPVVEVRYAGRGGLNYVLMVRGRAGAGGRAGSGAGRRALVAWRGIVHAHVKHCSSVMVVGAVVVRGGSNLYRIRGWSLLRKSG